jgi:CheY-like chemotaxis protein
MVDAVATMDETTRRSAPGRQVRLLVADDDERARALYVTLLGELDGVGSVVAAADGAEAVQLAGAFELDVAVLDLHMPRLDGLAAALELAALQPALAIALQSSDPESLRRRARAAGYPLFDKVDLDRVVAWVAGEVASRRRPARALRLVDDLSCARCGYGIATESPPCRCPMCDGAAEWIGRGTRVGAIDC